MRVCYSNDKYLNCLRILCPHYYTVYRQVTLLTHSLRLQWSSGSTLACCARGPRFESRCGQKLCVFTKVTAIRSFGHGLHTDCSA